MLIIVLGRPRPDDAARGRDDEPVLFLEIHDREVMALPIADGSATVQVEHERDLLAGTQVARIIEKELSTGLRIHGIAEIRDQLGGAVCVRTMQRWGRFALNAGDSLRRRGGAGGKQSGECRDGDQYTKRHEIPQSMLV